MKVELATQTLSNTVASALITYSLSPQSRVPSEAVHTANFIRSIDSLFDVFNSSTPYSPKALRRALRESSPHTEFLIQMEGVFAQLVALDSRGSPSVPPCFKGWQINIRAPETLWSRIRIEFPQVDFLRTRLLNQDPLENLFGLLRQKGGYGFNPTPTHFREALTKVMVASVLDLAHSDGTNCELDIAKFLFELSTRKSGSGMDEASVDEISSTSVVDGGGSPSLRDVTDGGPSQRLSEPSLVNDDSTLQSFVHHRDLVWSPLFSITDYYIHGR